MHVKVDISMNAINIVTLNVAGLNIIKRERIAQALKNGNIDIVFL